MNNLFPCAEWAEKLALKPADLTPEERAALQAHVATCPGCAATYADYQMLMARLHALPRPAARALPPLASEIVAVPEGQEEADGRYDGTGGNALTLPGREGALPPVPIPIPPARRRSWAQRLSAIAAALLVAVLVGSLALLLTSHHQPGTVTFKLRPGWTVIAEYSGVGSKTISGVDISIPYLWGSSFACIGSGRASAPATGPKYIGGFGGGDCTSASTTMLSPQYIDLFDTPHADKVDTIKVTANKDTRWYFQVLQAVPQPVKPGPEWLAGGGMDAEAGSSTFEGAAPYVQNGQPLQAKTWGILFFCIGTGNGYFQLKPDIGKFNLPACDGQTRLIKVHYGSATQVQAFTIVAAGDILWSAQLVGCANEQKCGS